MQDFLQVTRLSFFYESSVDPLFDDVGFQLQKGWTGIVGANGSGKTTLLQLICGLLQPDTGSISPSDITRIYCEQRMDSKPGRLGAFLHSTDKDAIRIKQSLDVQEDWAERWETLSHGERKRCQVSTALAMQPSVLALDEPSNHLDLNTRSHLFSALRTYKGIGLLVSHDRLYLDKLCHHTIFVFPPHIEIRKAPYTIAFREIERHNRFQRIQYMQAKKEVKKLKRKVIQHRVKAVNGGSKVSKKNIHRKDHDAKSKVDLARLTGKDSVEGRIQRRLMSQLNQARKVQEGIQYRDNAPLGIKFESPESVRFFPIIIPAGRLSLGDLKHLLVPELSIQRGDRIGIEGENGSGKSTFIRYLIRNCNLPGPALLNIPQEIEACTGREIIVRTKALSRIDKGRLMTMISRLGSDPTHMLTTEMPSPGELRKLILAQGLIRGPALIIMDEPTNHMDLPSIECLEKALAECNITQILVSHDQFFLSRLANTFWMTEIQGDQSYMLKVKG